MSLVTQIIKLFALNHNFTVGGYSNIVWVTVFTVAFVGISPYSTASCVILPLDFLLQNFNVYIHTEGKIVVLFSMYRAYVIKFDS